MYRLGLRGGSVSAASANLSIPENSYSLGTVEEATDLCIYQMNLLINYLVYLSFSSTHSSSRIPLFQRDKNKTKQNFCLISPRLDGSLIRWNVYSVWAELSAHQAAPPRSPHCKTGSWLDLGAWRTNSSLHWFSVPLLMTMVRLFVQSLTFFLGFWNLGTCQAVAASVSIFW